MYARKNESRRYPRRVTKSYTRDRNTLTRNLEFARELAMKRFRKNPGFSRYYLFWSGTSDYVDRGGYDSQSEAKKEAKRLAKESNKSITVLDGGPRGTFIFEASPVRGRSVSNPSDEDTLKSEKLTEKFHGRAPREIDEIEETEEFYDTFAVLGELTELGIIGEEIDSFHIIEDKNSESNLDVDSFDIQFETKIPKICVDPEGNCLEVIGGDQRLKTGDNKNQEQYVGPVWKIAYRTDKHHLEGSDGSVQEYEHHFGEEGKMVSTKRQNGFKITGPIQVKDLPRLVYDNVNKKIRLVSGSYTVEAEGIKN